MMAKGQLSDQDFGFLQDGGEMGRLTREYAWDQTVLGHPKTWPQSLKTTLSILFNSKFPMFLYWGPEHICFYNDAYRPSLGENGKHPFIFGQKAVEAWPEIWYYIEPLLTQVLTKGESTFNEDQLLPIYRNGGMEDVYWTFSFSPVMDESCRPAGVLVICTETTKKVAMVNSMLFSEQRFQTLVKDAAVGIIVLTGNQWIVEIVNSAYGKLIDRGVDELLNKPLFEIIPETAVKFQPILEQVVSSGKALYLLEHPYHVNVNDGKKTGYLNIVYQPYQDLNGITIGVSVLCQDVSEQVIARHVVETALEQMRLSKEAAKLGTFDMDLLKGTMEWDTRCRTLFGISHDQEVSYEKDFVPGLHPEDKERITTIISKLFIRSESDGDYDVEYRTVGADDHQLRWVRAKGTVYFDKNDKPVRFIGSVLDITKEKMEEFRKNDFVGIVSHELKTPLTTLMGVLQIVDKKLDDHQDRFLAGAMGKAVQQVKKMNNMITGFLNLSRFESGKIHLDMATFSLTGVIHNIIEDIQFSIKAEIQLMECGEVLIYGDREKIESVIMNLLTNAIKYSPQDKPIMVKCDAFDGQVIVSFIDKGYGIAKEDLDNIFERYYRVENSRSKQISGFGIGLYLSAEIIRLHKGHIWAESQLGIGSTFCFSLAKAGSVPKI